MCNAGSLAGALGLSFDVTKSGNAIFYDSSSASQISLLGDPDGNYIERHFATVCSPTTFCYFNNFSRFSPPDIEPLFVIFASEATREN